MIKLPGPYQRFKKSHPKVFRAYEKLGETAAESGPLDQKTRELVKLARRDARPHGRREGRLKTPADASTLPADDPTSD